MTYYIDAGLTTVPISGSYSTLTALLETVTLQAGDIIEVVDNGTIVESRSVSLPDVAVAIRSWSGNSSLPVVELAELDTGIHIYSNCIVQDIVFCKNGTNARWQFLFIHGINNTVQGCQFCFGTAPVGTLGNIIEVGHSVNTTLHNNFFYGFPEKWNGINLRGIAGTSNVSISGNTFYSFSGTAINAQLPGTSHSGILISRNVIHGKALGASGISYFLYAGNSIENNVAYGCVKNFAQFDPVHNPLSIYKSDVNLEVDPLFKNPSGGDFTITNPEVVALMV